MSLKQMDESTPNLAVRRIRKNAGDTRSLLGSVMSVKISNAETQGTSDRVPAIARKHGQVFVDNSGPIHAAL
jgi:hypothetical protein